MTREQFIKHVEGSQKAFRSFLVALCSGDSQQADDIAQEAYIKAYLSCDSFSNASKFNAWIYRIGYNTFVSHRRSQKVFAGYEEVRNVAAGDAADGNFQYQALYEALGRLSDKEKTSVLLFYMEGYSVKEIAEIIDSSPEAVKQHLARGRSHLRGLLSTQVSY